tara:strand:+ start:145 stop:570 length:426 start_codon:yes stop_codon:yes gene_type:complete
MAVTDTKKLSKKYYLSLTDTAKMVEAYNLPFHHTGSANVYLVDSKAFEKVFLQHGLKPNTEWVKDKVKKERDDERRRMYEQLRAAIQGEKSKAKKSKLKQQFINEYGGKGGIDYTKQTWEQRQEDISARRAANILKNRHTP